MSAAGIEQLVGSGHFQPDDDIPYALRTFGAVFVEVGVDPELGLVRLRRVVGRYSVGRDRQPAHRPRADGRRDRVGVGQGHARGQPP